MKAGVSSDFANYGLNFGRIFGIIFDFSNIAFATLNNCSEGQTLSNE